MTFARRRFFAGSAAALGLGALSACTSDESRAQPSVDQPSDQRSDGGSSNGDTSSWGPPTEITEVLGASTLLALGDGTSLRLGATPDTVELVQHGAVLWQAGGTGTEPGRFHRVTSAATGPDGSIWIVDAGNRRVQVLTASGEPARVLGAPSGDSVPLRRPTAIAVGSDGRAYVADAGRAGVVPFGADGTPGELIGGFGAEHSFAGISALQLTEHELIVVEALVPRVQVWDHVGVWRRAIDLPEHFAVADIAAEGEQLFLVSIDGRLARTSIDGSTAAAEVEHLGHIGGHARGLHLGTEGLAVTAVPVPSYLIA